MLKYLPNTVTVYPNTVRLDIQLHEPDDTSYNSISYPKLLNLEVGKDTNSNSVGLTTEDTFDRFKDYEEESYIDNTEVFRDTFPAGKEPELGGFYINSGKLKLKANLNDTSKSVDKKKRDKKKISSKTKVQSKSIRKKEGTKSEAKKSKHEKGKIRVSHKMYSNIGLDSLLNTVRKQKKNGTVKNIKMPSTSKRSLVTGASKKSKELGKVAPKKRVSSKKRANTSISAKVIVNSTEVTIPREDFLSTKTAPFHSRSSTSDPDEIEIVKEKIHSVYKNEHNFVKDNRTLKTAMTLERDQVSTSIHTPLSSNKIAAESVSANSSLPSIMTVPSNTYKANVSKENSAKISRTSDTMRSSQSPLATIPNEPSRPCLYSVFSSSSILDKKKTSPNSSQTTEPVKVFHAPEIAINSDFISITPALKRTKPLSPNNPTIPRNNSSNRKVTANNAFTTNSPMQNTRMSLSYSEATVPQEVLHSSRKISPKSSSIACSNLLNTDGCSSTSKATIPKGESHSYFKYATEYAPFQDNLQIMAERNPSKTTMKTVQSSTSKATITPVHSSYAKATITPIQTSSSKAIITPLHSRSSKTNISPIQSSSSKATITPIPSSSSKATVSPFHSSSAKATISPIHSRSSKTSSTSVHSSYLKTRPADSRSSKPASMPAHSSYSKATSMPVYSSSSKSAGMPVHSSYSKTTITPIQSISPKATISPLQSSSSKVSIRREMLNSSCEFAMPTGCTLANNKDSHPANNWDKITENSTSVIDVSKYMLNVIHNESSNSTSNSMSTYPFNSSDNFFYCGNNLPFNSSYRTYSKASKNSFQPIVKTTTVATSSVTISQTNQTSVMNSVNSSYDTTAVNLHKMNISPVVKCKKPQGKF